jgi:hypothetical protein
VSSSSPAPRTQQSIELAPSDGGPILMKNPTYPTRNHFGEKLALEEKLRSWQQKIEAMAQKLAAIGTHANRSAYERLYHQMMGARDQMTEAVGRMPKETGDLYDEDHERLVNAEAALVRLMQRWEALKS